MTECYTEKIKRLLKSRGLYVRVVQPEERVSEAGIVQVMERKHDAIEAIVEVKADDALEVSVGDRVLVTKAMHHDPQNTKYLFTSEDELFGVVEAE